MQAYYLNEPLSEEEVAEVAELTGWTVTQVRVPYLMPSDESAAIDLEQQLRAPMLALRAAGLLTQYGKQVALIGCLPVHVNTLFVEAIARVTGRYPYLVQTKAMLEALEVSDSLRVLNLDVAMGQ